ncbi:ATP-binding cassette domain-containing protein [Sediminicola luteus]|uniref:ABC transporter domain-containing protein n=1 Tax=Sediminicola luteus TaxID=319238 RepID=A0A2A4G604_9FLAO|nr:ATP-binding cassette domain-containing protein [Sediminicola luteus]PCE64399.1 hypothetical protein B7P33_08900 [Sediminicola luteus]
MGRHWAIFTTNESNKKGFLKLLVQGKIDELEIDLSRPALYSRAQILKAIQEEEIHDDPTYLKAYGQSLGSMSSGERKKRFLEQLLSQNISCLILDNPFDHLDLEGQQALRQQLETLEKTPTICLLSRRSDALSITTNTALLENTSLIEAPEEREPQFVWTSPLPKPIHSPAPFKSLFAFKNVNVAYEDKPVLQDISWEVKQGEFWQLKGPNGSGKSTILSMVSGDNPKGYGQELYLFGHKKGSGESVWELKKHIGYFTPSLLDSFKGYHTLENMIVSGLTDSIGLYTRPKDTQIRKAKEWLSFLGLADKAERYFHELSLGYKHLIMIARAMTKHPPLLILDEPTAGLDDESCRLFTSMVNKISAESDTTIVFVSHRNEPGLAPKKIYELTPGPSGATGKTTLV